MPSTKLLILGLVVAAVATGCSGGPSHPSSASTLPGSPKATDSGGGAAEATRMLTAAAGDDAGAINSGSGPLENTFGSSLPGPVNAGSVAFLLACTGPGTWEVSFSDRGQPLPTLTTRHRCQDGILRRSIPTKANSQLSFSATAISPGEGGFAFRYLPEKS